MKTRNVVISLDPELRDFLFSLQQERHRSEERIIGAINHLRTIMTTKATLLAAIGVTLVADLARNTDVTMSALLAFNTLKDQLAVAIAGASDAGITPEELASFQAIHDGLAANSSKLAAALAQTNGQPAPNLSPLSITGTGTASGTFSVAGFVGPVSFGATSDDLTGFTVNSDGSYSGTAESGTLNVEVTDNGVTPATVTSFPVSVSITEAVPA